jgi:hypothetical protein
MNRNAIKDVLYGGLIELASNRKFYYTSSVNRQYCHWTDEGEAAVKEFLVLMTPMIMETEDQTLDQRARDLVMKELKT